jgi:predicted nucleotidyltransferase
MNVNTYMVGKIARALGPLRDAVVFVGGATVNFYVADHYANDVRPTKDVDLVLEVLSYGELEALRENLIQLGFYPTIEDDVPCRFRFEGIIVDVMSTKSVGWAPANPWFELGYQHAISREIDGMAIKILTLPFFLATKLAAFQSRSKDPRTSRDLEDLTFLLNVHPTWEIEMQAAPPILRAFLKEQFQRMLGDARLLEGIEGNLPPDRQAARLDLLVKRMRGFIKGE